MNLSEYKKDLAYSNEELAIKFGLSHSCITHYLSGLRRPNRNTAKKMELISNGKLTIKDLRGE